MGSRRRAPGGHSEELPPLDVNTQALSREPHFRLEECEATEARDPGVGSSTGDRRLTMRS
jgi:hypothetical protein